MKVLGEKIERFLDIVGNVCEVVCSILALFMVFLVTLQVILRFFNMPLITDISYYLGIFPWRSVCSIYEFPY